MSCSCPGYILSTPLSAPPMDQLYYSMIDHPTKLLLVRNLCATLCFSMEFVVFMDFLGTVVLPVAIALTYFLITTIASSHQRHSRELSSVVLLGGVIGLLVLILIMTSSFFSFPRARGQLPAHYRPPHQYPPCPQSPPRPSQLELLTLRSHHFLAPPT